jgi:hypothetical protein
LPFYGRIAPMSWLMARDIQQARLHMNLSQWQKYSAEERIMMLSAVGSAVRNHEMSCCTARPGCRTRSGIRFISGRALNGSA